MKQLASFLDRQYRPITEVPETGFMLSGEELDGILANVLAQKKFLDGIRAAQPLVDEIARYSAAYLDSIKDTQDRMRAWISWRIHEDHAGALKYQDVLEEAQIHAFNSLVLLRDYRQGINTNALAELLETDQQLTEILPSATNASQKDLSAIEDRLFERQAEIRSLKDQLAPDLEEYRNQILEMDRVMREGDNLLVRTRITIIVWSRAHDRLAQGVTDPAKIDMMGIAKRAINMALPY